MAKKKRRPNTAKSKHKPITGRGKPASDKSDDEGPLGWFLPQIEAAYTRLAEIGAPAPRSRRRRSRRAFRSAIQPGADETVLQELDKSIWVDTLSEYRRRKSQASRPRRRTTAVAPTAPIVPGGRNWRPMGPNIVLDGQTVGEQPVAGRVVGLAMSSQSDVCYVATAAGGVFRSDDAGASWRSLMDGFDVDPTDFASASLACGAIAISPLDDDRIYVGTGEGDTHAMFQQRVTNALPAYRGIGPIRSDDGGTTWVTERTASASPDLAGDAFFALAVDIRNEEHVIGATTLGLYQRVSRRGGGHEWRQRRTNIHSSVVLTNRGSTTRFFAAEWGNGVFHSSNGNTWRRSGTHFPTNSVGRIALAVQPDNPDLVYAFVARQNGQLHGVYRLDSVGGRWLKLRNVPDVLPGGQGSYDLAIAVDPHNDGIIYLAGDHMGQPPWAGSVWRCLVTASGSSLRITDSESIGTHAHADVHVLGHRAGNSNELWCGTDGGVFVNRNPTASGHFASRNQGLSCLCSNFIAQHPTNPDILFTGLQDNGTARTASAPTWTHVSGGDGGYCLINWANPRQVLVFMNGRVLRSTSGGVDDNSWSSMTEFPWATMTQPIVCPPYNPSSPGDARVVALGAGGSIFISNNFGSSWPTSFDLPSGSGNLFALAFSDKNRLFMGTTAGRVFRADKSRGNWNVQRIDNVTAGPLGLVGLITDVAVDCSDANEASIYICFGGMGDPRRVWHFDGIAWQSRSGTAANTRLLDVEHNALVVDAMAPANVYAGANIGVWHSPDAGATWQPFQNGLPDAPVFDLQMHATQRLLRASTHGRGVYEITL